MFFQKICQYFTHDLRLWETEVKDVQLINLVEKHLWQPSTQAVSWTLITAFSKIYNEKQSKAYLKRLHCAPKELVPLTARWLGKKKMKKK